jgi:hypothetical protein
LGKWRPTLKQKRLEGDRATSDGRSPWETLAEETLRLPVTLTEFSVDSADLGR